MMPLLPLSPGADKEAAGDIAKSEIDSTLQIISPVTAESKRTADVESLEGIGG